MTIDALILLMRQASRLDLSLPQVREALKDLYEDAATDAVMASKYDHLRRGEIASGRNRLTRSRGDQMWCAGPFRFRETPGQPDLKIWTLSAFKALLETGIMVTPGEEPDAIRRLAAKAATPPGDVLGGEGGRDRIKSAILEWLAPYSQEYRTPHDRLVDLILAARPSQSDEGERRE